MSRARQFTDGLRGTGIKTGLAPDLKVNYELVGDWKRANFMLSRFPQKVQQGINLALRDFTHSYAKQVKSNLQNNGASLGWEPIVSEAYRDFKTRMADADVDDMLRFFFYLQNNIKAQKIGNNWVAGITPNVYNDKMGMLRDGNTLSVAEYAGVMEHGALHRNIMPRPLWYPSYLQLGGNAGLKKTVITHIRAMFPSVGLKMPMSRSRF